MDTYKKDGWTISNWVDKNKLTGKTHAFEIDDFKNDTTSHFLILSNDIVYHLNNILTGNELKLILGVLTRFQHKDNEAKKRHIYFWSEEEIRKISGLSKSQYETAMKSLKAKGIIKESESKKKYIIQIPKPKTINDDELISEFF